MNLLVTTRGWARSALNRTLRPNQYARAAKLLQNVAATVFSGDCVKLSIIYGTGKWGEHWYAQHYNRHFLPLRNERVTILEIGVGGYANPKEGGTSLRVWKKFFPRGRIVGIDIYDKHAVEERRIRTYQGSQSDRGFLERVVEEVGRPDIVIDDGSHQNADVIASFGILFPLLKDDGIYVVEDTQTSYWPPCGGVAGRAQDGRTSMGLFQSLTDGLNHREYMIPGYTPSYLDQHIVAMHFYHNLVFIYKGLNDEASIGRPHGC